MTAKLGNMKLQAKQRLQATSFEDYVEDLDKVDFNPNLSKSDKQLLLQGARSQDWFHKLEESTKKKYRKKYPGTKFVDKTHLKLPE